jgi:cytochrome P450
MGTPAELVRLEDPEFYDVRSAPILAQMRAESPVFYYEPLNTWVLSKYDDIKYASKTPEIYSVRKGILLNDARFGYSVADTFFEDGAELISTTDPPRHGQIRRTLAPAFTPRMIARFEESIRTCSRRLIDELEPDQPIDFIHAAARVLPIQAVAELLGVPADEVDVDKIQFWTDEMLKMGAPLSKEQLELAAANAAEMGGFLMELLGRKRSCPGEDLMTTLASAELDESALSEANILMLAIATLVAGNETTRNLLAGSMWSLAENPDQAKLLVEDLSLAKQTVEETLRWITPVPGFMRNAQQDVELRGTKISAGDYVYLLYFAANRDEDCWSDPDRYDIARPPDPSVLSFGFGQHACIGAALARLEARCFLEELFTRFDGVSIAGLPQRVPSPLQHGWATLPVAFSARS